VRPIAHLTIRVAWHQQSWDGTVCKTPSENPYCSALPNIRKDREKLGSSEDAYAGQSFDALKPEELPPCKRESGFFMSPHAWMREFDHPYRSIKKCKSTHGGMRKRLLKIPAYTAIAVPFNWMLRRNQKNIDLSTLAAMPADTVPPFPTPWVFGRERQEALLDLMASKLTPKKSLVFFYTKEGHPLGDQIRRLLVGVGCIAHVGPREHYDTVDGNAGYPFWDRLITHSIRSEGEEGFLLPYQEYLSPTGDVVEDERRQNLLQEIIVAPPDSHQESFSYGSELADADVALSILIRSLAAVRRIRKHQIVSGPWQKREQWLSDTIASVWKDRGAFPGTGVMLEALGMRLGTSLVVELRGAKAIGPTDNPWDVLGEIFDGKRPPPDPAFRPHLQNIAAVWKSLQQSRRDILQLFSRFDLTARQAKRIWDETKRRESLSISTTDQEILVNPYLLVERDLGDSEDQPISMEALDHALLPDKALAAAPPVPAPSAIEAASDPRRIRCGLVTVLRRAARDGDSLLSVEEALARLADLSSHERMEVNTDWIEGHRAFLEGAVVLFTVDIQSSPPKTVPSVQLKELQAREEKLGKLLRARSEKVISKITTNWKKLIQKAVEESGQTINLKSPRHAKALEEQADALEKITSRKLTVLVGRAGTGKTSVVGALTSCPELEREGMLLLAPTGKARVRLQGATQTKAMTVAQFLTGLKRYDRARQRPLFEGPSSYGSARTVIIDETSMLTMDDLFAVLQALDLTFVQRIILVGDPNQLPPIGVGRPFADLVAWLSSKDSGALARLNVEVRTVRLAGDNGAETVSDTLKLAAWFTDIPPDTNADRILSDIHMGANFNDLEIIHWDTASELRQRLLEQFRKNLPLSDVKDIAGFNRSLGLQDNGRVRFENPDGIENWQILSPVRMNPYGVLELNRWVQSEFRRKEKESARNYRGAQIGAEGIVTGDKVINLANGEGDCYNWQNRTKTKEYVANGEIGAACEGQQGYLNIFYANRPMLSFGHKHSDFGEDEVPLELAYALTIHKAQGSQFRTVFVILPKRSRLLSRELLYTALTRARQKLILLVEGRSIDVLYDLSRPERSSAFTRNTNLFNGALRERISESPHAEHLIHRTEKGHMVRSKSELIIANLLWREGVVYEYEKPLDGTVTAGRLHPDFSFGDLSGERIIWEHLGMMQDPDYARGWEWKKRWYSENGYVEGGNLFVSTERSGGGIDMREFHAIVKKLKSVIM
jgi:hypothetical protein